MNKKELDTKLLRFIDAEEITEDEKTEIQQWINHKKENKTYFEQIKKISEEKKYLNQLKKVDINKNWTKFQDSINEKTELSPDYSFLQKNRLYITRIAAAILLLMLTGTILYFVKFKTVSQVQQVSSILENTEVKLSDGSTILLNKGSALSYPEKLNRRRREVKLTGEAYFEVTKTERSPFYVYLKNTTVQVLGTSFNIKEKESGLVEVYVLTGKVSFFETGKKSDAIQLDAGQKGIFDSSIGRFEKGTFDSENFLFWKTRNLSFVNQHLAIVFKDLEKSFGTRIVVKNRDILQNKFTSYCEGQELEDILNELSILFNINYYKKGDIIYVEK